MRKKEKNMGLFEKNYNTSEEFNLDACYPKNYESCLKFIQNTLKKGEPYPGDFTHEKLVVLEFGLLTNIENTPRCAVKYARLLEENILHYVKLSLKNKKRKGDYLYFLPTAYIEKLYENLYGMGKNAVSERQTVAFVLSYLWIREKTLEVVYDTEEGKRCYDYFADAERYHDSEAVNLILPKIEKDLQELDLEEEYQSFKANRVEPISCQTPVTYSEGDTSSAKCTVRAEEPAVYSDSKAFSAKSTVRAKEPAVYSDSKASSAKSTEKVKKPGKGKLVGRIFLKSLCVIFGAIIILFALLSFFMTKGQIPDDQRVGTLIGQVASGAFCFGLWLFYYGTIVALKKAGVKVRDDLKDPSFWEVVSVTTVTTYYSDGSKEEKKYSNIKGSFFGEIVIFLVIFALVQTYYFVAAPILGIISLSRDVKMLKEWNK